MASVEHQLISRIIRTGEIQKVQEWGITIDDIFKPEAQGLFNVIEAYFAASESKGSIPGVGLLKEKYDKNFELVDDPAMTLDALCLEVRKNRLSIEVKNAAQELIQRVDSDPVGAINQMSLIISKLQNLSQSQRTDVSFDRGLTSIAASYEMSKKGLLLGIQWPWDVMNETTGGMQPDDYVIIYGRPKSMKTWVLACLLAWCWQQGVRILLYTKEMTPENIMKRVAAIVISVAYQDLRMGKMSAEEEDRFYALLDQVQLMTKKDHFICLSGQDVAEGGDTISWIHSKINKYKPEVVFIDGLYLMSDGSKKSQADWTRVTSISRSARKMQLATRIPLIATVQANRKAEHNQGAQLDEIAYADAIGQDATIALRSIAGPNTINLVFGGSREFKMHGFQIGGVPATDFHFKRVLTEKDIDNAKKAESKRDEIDDPANHVKPRQVRKPTQEEKVVEAIDKNLNGHVAAMTNGTG